MSPNNLNISSINILEEQLVCIPKGEIYLNDDRIKQKWKVDVPSFLLGKYPVTQKIYYAITKESPSTFIGEEKPVETISWKDAITFCNSISEIANLSPCYLISDNGEEIKFDKNSNGYRLPTEAEWEYACKARTTTVIYGEIEEIAWYKNNSLKTTHNVGLKKPNAWGLFDMLGNVWEWCSDIYDETVYGSYRIIRGGGWFDNERGCMATNRRRSHPLAYKIDDLGFRIARNIEK